MRKISLMILILILKMIHLMLKQKESKDMYQQVHSQSIIIGMIHTFTD